MTSLWQMHAQVRLLQTRDQAHLQKCGASVTDNTIALHLTKAQAPIPAEGLLTEHYIVSKANGPQQLASNGSTRNLID